MKLREHFTEHAPEPVFRDFVRSVGARNQPPLDLAQMKVAALFRPMLHTPTTGDGTLLLCYKSSEAGVVSAQELQDGREWRVLQVQGANTKKSYRVASMFEWQRCLAAQWRWYAQHPDAEVEAVTMPTLAGIPGILNAHCMESASQSYDILRRELGMRLSQKEELWIMETSRRSVGEILGSPTIHRLEENARERG